MNFWSVIKNIGVGEKVTLIKDGHIKYCLTLRREGLDTISYTFQGECLRRNFHHISYGTFYVNERRRKVRKQIVRDTIKDAIDPTYARIRQTMFA
jgi:hypothetical protein